jgi:UDP-N-acetyl-D-glucosamine dehydrogenase
VTDVGIVGAGYVGVPLAQVFAAAGKSVVLFDVNQDVVDALNRGESHIEDVPSEVLRPLVENGLRATTDFDELHDADAILVAVPTPLSKQREPDLSYVERAATDISKRLRKGQLVVLESTTYPGTTREKVLPILELSGLKVGEDFSLAFSPERVDDVLVDVEEVDRFARRGKHLGEWDADVPGPDDSYVSHERKSL